MRILVYILWLLWILACILAWALPTVGTGYILFVNHDWINVVYICIGSVILFLLKVGLYMAWTSLEDRY